MIVAVTGTRWSAERPDTWWWLDKFRSRYEVTLWVLGDSYRFVDDRGVDGLALDWAQARGEPHVVVLADKDEPSPRRFHLRDAAMAAYLASGDACLGLPGPNSRGTWLTMRLCRARGANAYECKLRGNLAP